MRYNGTRAAVLGMGTSGEAAARLLCREGAAVTVFDSASGEQLAERIATLRAAGAECVTGKEAEAARATFDLTVLSPGIDPAVPLVQNFLAQGAVFTGELELGYQFCTRPVVAITGTNGKTTTTQLIETMLNDAGIGTIACGNIGLPFCDAVSNQAELDLFTVEVSSFQLETISTFRPQVAVWLNFTPDHLDRYASLDQYRSAKYRIFDYQGPEDFVVVNESDHLIDLAARRVSFSAYSHTADFTLRDGQIIFQGHPILAMADTNLSGLHNAENLMAALGVAHVLGVPFEKALVGLRRYHLMAHRCEAVGQVNGVAYINDSKATNLDALAKVLDSQTAPVVLIAGGKDKGFDFNSLSELVARKTRKAILIGEMAERIREGWAAVTDCVVVDSLQQAVEAAHQTSVPGEVVLFSPGTSSFDMFKNYADRGNQFRDLVHELSRVPGPRRTQSGRSAAGNPSGTS